MGYFDLTEKLAASALAGILFTGVTYEMWRGI